MSLIKSVSTSISGHTVQMNLPDKKTVVLRGISALHLLYITESLLSQDFTGYYWELDKQYGYFYNKVEGTSILSFNDGAIQGKDEVIKTFGTIPNIHVIRYLDNNFRSSFLSKDVHIFAPNTTDMRQYSHVISDTQWFRLIALVNDVIGKEVITLRGTDLQFDFDASLDISIEGQQVIYMLLAECFLTPENYHRVLLLPDIECLSNEVQIRLLEQLDNIKGHSLTLSLADINPTELKPSSVISFLNV